MSEYTKTPWEVREPNGSGNGFQAGPAWIGRNVHTGEAEANARHIVRCVNNHERLVEALEMAHEAMTVFDTGCGFMRDEFDFSEDRMNIAILLKELGSMSE